MSSSNEFYRDRKGNIFPRYKEDICNEVDVYAPHTFLPILEAMDYPFMEDEWLRLIQRQVYHQEPVNCKAILGRYLAKMNLMSNRALTFKDSCYTKDVLAYQPDIKWTFIDEKYLDEHTSDTPYNK